MKAEWRSTAFFDVNGGNMWYVIQTGSGQEEKIKLECERLISEKTLQRCVLPMYEEKIKYKGEWHLRKKKLFPGYLFMISDELEILSDNLKKINGITKLLKAGETVVPLKEEEIVLIKKLIGDDDVMKMSEGLIENDKVIILSGPLKGMESSIKKLDRHKRKAWISIEMFNREQLVEVGAEILRKVNESPAKQKNKDDGLFMDDAGKTEL